MRAECAGGGDTCAKMRTALGLPPAVMKVDMPTSRLSYLARPPPPRMAMGNAYAPRVRALEHCATDCEALL